MHDGIERLVQRSQAVIAGLPDDFVSPDLTHALASGPRAGGPFFAFVLNLDLLEILPVCINVLYFSAAPVDGVIFAGDDRAGIGDGPLIVRRVGTLAIGSDGDQLITIPGEAH